jgi:cholesterol transport system auxiliary component
MKPSFLPPSARINRQQVARQRLAAPGLCGPSLTEPSLTRRAWLTAGVAAALASLGACSFSRPAPVKTMVLVEAAPPPAAATTRAASLRIGVINVAAPFRGRTLVFRKDDITYESDFYSEFFVAPSAMLAEATAKALVAAKVFKRVIPPGAAPDDSEYVLDGFVSELYGDLREAGKPAAVLTATFYLSSATAAAVTAKVLWSREYRQRVPAADVSPAALARAWNTALSTMLADLARDLATADLSAP